jgi:alpha-L-arabinofuranosidase
MNEESKGAGPKSCNGPRYFRWWLIAVAATFLILLTFTQSLPGGTRSFSDGVPPTLFLLGVGVAAATAGVGGWRFVRWVCCRRNFIKVLAGCGGLVVLIGVILAVEVWRGLSAMIRSGREVETKVEQAPAMLPAETKEARVSVDAGSTVRTVDARLFGVDAPFWDSLLDTPETASTLRELDVHSLRFAEFFDEYHWASGTVGTNSNPGPVSFSNFAHVATNIHAQVFITVNYGSGTVEEAAAWVRWANISNHYGFKCWIIGNENYGPWEHDENSPPHDPVTYARRAKDYFSRMKAADPSIKIGVPVTENYMERMGVLSDALASLKFGEFIIEGYQGWTPKMFATLQQLGVTPDFVDLHRYPEGSSGLENDARLLQSTARWTEDAASLRRELKTYFGDANTNVELLCTENNSIGGNTGKQTTSLVNGLYLADSFGQIAQTEFNSWLWWDLRNAQDRKSNNSSKLYGWRQYGDHGMMSGNDTRYPTFYTFKLLKYFARGGDRIVRTASDNKLLSVYAAQRADATMSLLVINKSRDVMLKADFSITGFQPESGATVYSYGIPQDEAARTGTGSQDIAQTNFTGAAAEFPCTFPPYSATVIALSPRRAK